MTSNNKLRETFIKNRSYYYLDNLINNLVLKIKNIHKKNHIKVFLFTTLDMKHHTV